MGCFKCNSNRRNNKNTEQMALNQREITTTAEMEEIADITEWLRNNGWRYVGDCGCRQNKGMYLNDSYAGILILALPKLFEICYFTHNVMSRKRITGGSGYVFTRFYEQYVLNANY